MTLSTIYKAFGCFHIVFGIILLSGQLHVPIDWLRSIGNPTLGLNFFSAMIVIGYIFWMLPNWISENQLKIATMPLIWIQFFLFLIPIYHAMNSSIPVDIGFWLQNIILVLFIILFYRKSRA